MYQRDRKTDFFEAIKKADGDSLLKMLEEGYSPDYRMNDDLNTNALTCAVTSKARTCIDLLLQAGAYVDAKDKHGMTAAMYAADRGYSKILKDLQSNKADMNAVDNSGKNALMLASMWGQRTCLQFLLGLTENINLKDLCGRTAVAHAAIHGKDQCLRRLIDYNADLNIRDSNGDTALMSALRHDELQCAEMLLNSRAKINVLNTEHKTALTIAFERSQGNFSFVERLLQAGADVTLTHHDRAYLHEMVARDQKKIVQLMIISGCAPFDKRCQQHFYNFSHHREPISPLCVALLSGFDDIAKYFIVNRFYTPYDICTLPNDPEVLIKLRARGSESQGVLDVLKLLCSQPQSLLTLTFVTLSNIFNQTNRRERVQQSRLPKTLQEALLFQSASRICVLYWHDIPLTGQFYPADCQCVDCNITKGIRPVVKREASLPPQHLINDLNVCNEATQVKLNAGVETQQQLMNIHV